MAAHPVWRRVSASITASLAPPWGPRWMLLIASRSERVMPGTPLREILSPAATSITSRHSHQLRAEAGGQVQVVATALHQQPAPANIMPVKAGVHPPNR